MRRRAAVLAAAMGAVVVMAGCSSAEDDYCEALSDRQAELAGLAGDADAGAAGGEVLTRSLAAFEQLQDASPDELRDEWDTLVFAVRALVERVEELGLDLTNPDALAGLTQREREEVAGLAAQLASPRVRDAVTVIEQHASEVCDVDLSM